MPLPDEAFRSLDALAQALLDHRYDLTLEDLLQAADASGGLCGVTFDQHHTIFAVSDPKLLSKLARTLIDHAREQGWQGLAQIGDAEETHAVS